MITSQIMDERFLDLSNIMYEDKIVLENRHRLEWLYKLSIASYV